LQGVCHKTFVAPVDVPTFEAAAREWLETKADRKTSTVAGWQTHVDLASFHDSASYVSTALASPQSSASVISFARLA
jgi:hypothetical protein